MGGLDHLDDLGQHGLSADLPRLEAEGARGVQRAARDLDASGLLDRDRLARQHGFIDEGGAVRDHAVDRHPLAGAHHDHVADLDRIDGHVLLDAVAHHAGGLGLQRHQTTDRLTRAPLGPRLDPAPDQDQGDDHRRRLEIDVGRAFRQPLRRKGRHRREGPGRRRAQHDEGVHVRRPAQQGGHALAVEDDPRHEQHEGRQHEADDLPVEGADGLIDPVMHPRHEVRAHLQHEQRQGRSAGDQHRAAQLPDLGVASGLFAVAGVRPGVLGRLQHIAGLFDGGGQILERRRS